MRVWDKSKPPTGPWVLNKDSLQAQNLIAWWSFDGVDGGDRLWDMSGVTNAHASNTDTIATGWTRHPSGARALKFNGTNNGFSTAAGLFNFQRTSSFMVAWTGDFGTRGPVTCKDNGVNPGWQIDQDRTAGLTSMSMLNAAGGQGYIRDCGTTTNDTVIRPKLMAHDGTVSAASGINWYVDGVLNNGGSTTIGTGNPGTLVDGGIYIGKRTFSGSFFSTSTLSDIRIYNTIANAATLAAAIASPETKFELWYPLRSRKWFSIGAAPTFLPAWALGSNASVIGSGIHA